MWQLCCARILLNVLRTLQLGAFPWLQPRSPVVQRAVESGRGPDPPDVNVEVLKSAPRSAPAARVKRRGAGLANPPGGRAVDARVAHAKQRRGRVAASVLVVNRSLLWHASSALPAESFTRLQTWVSARSTRLPNSSRIASSFKSVRQPLRYLVAAVALRPSCAFSHFSTSLNTRSRP
jgi:hypothetical protein